MNDNDVRMRAASLIHNARPDLPVEYIANSAALWADEHGGLGFIRRCGYGATTFDVIVHADASIAHDLRRVNACFKW